MTQVRMENGWRTVRMALICLVSMFPWHMTVSHAGAGSLDDKRAKMQVKRVAVVSEFLQLEPREEPAFWSLYEEYRADAAKMNDGLVRLIREYARDSDHLSDHQAEQLLNEFLQLKQEKVQLQYQYVGRFRQILPGRKVARLFQLEQKLDATLEADLADVVPLVK